jgi:hypothetical protein
VTVTNYGKSIGGGLLLMEKYWGVLLLMEKYWGRLLLMEKLELRKFVYTLGRGGRPGSRSVWKKGLPCLTFSRYGRYSQYATYRQYVSSPLHTTGMLHTLSMLLMRINWCMLPAGNPLLRRVSRLDWA